MFGGLHLEHKTLNFKYSDSVMAQVGLKHLFTGLSVACDVAPSSVALKAAAGKISSWELRGLFECDDAGVASWAF